MKKNLALLFVILMTSLSVGAATKSTVKLKHKLLVQSSKVSKLAAQIKHLDKKLSSTNNAYISKVKSIEAIERKIGLMQSELQKSASKISKDYQNSQKALNHYLLELSDTENENSLMHKEIYLELFKKKMSKLKAAQKISNQLLETINLYDQKLTETRSNEEIVYNLIVELETKKKEMSQEYISILENKNQTEARLDKIKAKKIAYKKVYKKTRNNSKVTIAMNVPLENFVSAKKSKKGIILKFKEIAPVKAPSSGKIVYTGELASYGNIIMIDHGNDVRSVIFGDMKIKANKGDLVQKSQVIGYTMADPGIEKSLYYEIRKKNIAQNTMQWISGATKKNLKI